MTWQAEAEKLAIIQDHQETCGRYGAVLICSAGHKCFVRAACDTWGCEKCQSHQKMKYKKRLEPRLANRGARELKFVTLTLPQYVSTDLEIVEHHHREAVRFLSKHFNGGLVVLEFTRRGQDQIFLHFHAIVTGGYVLQSRLQEAWSEVNGGLAMVDIRVARSGSLNYLLKYLTKGISGYSSSEMQEIAAVFYKRQRLRSFGELRHPVEGPTLYAVCPICKRPLTLLQSITSELDYKMWPPGSLNEMPPPDYTDVIYMADIVDPEDREYWTFDHNQTTFDYDYEKGDDDQVLPFVDGKVKRVTTGHQVKQDDDLTRNGKRSAVANEEMAGYEYDHVDTGTKDA